MGESEFLNKGLATILFAGVLVINSLANILPLNGLTTGEVSNLYPSLFTPSGYAFSIWSIIYLLLICFVVYTWVRKGIVEHQRLLILFSVSCVLNILWIFVWHHLMAGLSVILMIGLLITLTLIFQHIRQHIERKKYSLLFIHLPFTIYLAWISVATIANISAYLVGVNWDGFGIPQEVWASVMIGVAAILGCVFFLKFHVIEYVAVIIWAIVGIMLRWMSSEFQMIVYTSGIAIALLLVVVMLSVFARKRSAS